MKNTRARAVVVLLSLLAAFCAADPHLEKIQALPDFQLVDQGGRFYGIDDLRGHVTVVDFIFTRCGATCPILTKKMSDLVASATDDDLRFVSITVDPGYDTPQVLTEYRSKVTSDPRWVFLTGDRDEIIRLSRDGFSFAIASGLTPTEPILHSDHFVLVDREGVIRNYYDISGQTSLDQIRREADWLVDHPGR